MRIRAIPSDLDGTLLEPDGSVRPEALSAIARLRGAGVPVCPVTSKTPAELVDLLPRLGIEGPAGFENGAGIRRRDGKVELAPAAVPVARLRRILGALRRAVAVAVRPLEELGTDELAAITGLAGRAVKMARRRLATLPLVVDPRHDDLLRRALPAEPALRLVRGNRFLHLQGAHDKADVVPRLLAEFDHREGVVVACGDAANDADLLAAADIAVVVPGAEGADPTLLARCPTALVAPLPHGRGWATVVEGLRVGACRTASGA